MDLRNCRDCGRPFLYKGRPICPACVAEEARDFDRIRQFLAEHPDANAQEVADGTGISVDRILRLLKDGRLQLRGETSGSLACERCGRVISSGRLCRECAGALSESLSRAVAPAPRNDSSDERSVTRDYHMLGQRQPGRPK